MNEGMELAEKHVFDASDITAQPTPLHSDAAGVVHDSGDLCDSDCIDCD